MLPLKEIEITQYFKWFYITLLKQRGLKSVNLLALLMTILSGHFVASQELPSIKNFFPTDYNGENQNWSISQSSNKLIYAANNKGLLEYNGAYWKRYPSPNESIIRSVKVVDSLVFSGSYMEFGYWKKNEYQILEYTSLSQQIKVKLIEDEEFWNILNIDDWMIFQSLERIYLYNMYDKSFTVIDSDSKITKIFELDQEIYFQKLGDGLFKINNGKSTLFIDDEIAKTNEIINIFGNKKDLIVLTKEAGFYAITDGEVTKSKELSNEVLSNMSIYDAIKLKNNNYALGTIANGLIIISGEGEIVSKANLDNGLINNTVLSLFEDEANTIWLGLDNGISYVDTDSPYEIHNEKNGISGSVYASAIHKGYLYLGTNQGLFYRKQESTDDFKFIQGTQGQVWCLNVIDEALLCGHDSGTFDIDLNKITKISDIQATWNISKIDNKTNLILQGNYNGLYVLEKLNNRWTLRNKLQGFNNSSRYFETLGNQIFVNHEYKGIFKLRVNEDYTAIESVTIDSTLKGSDSGITKYNGELLYAYKKGIYKYDNTEQRFLKDSLLSQVYKEQEYVSGKLITDEKDNFLWIFTKSNIRYITPNGLSTKQRIKNIPLGSDVRKGIPGYENILMIDEGKYLIGASSGYILVDINEPKNEDFFVHIGQILNSSSPQNFSFQNIKLKNSFENDQNNFKISFYTPEFNRDVSTRYQYQLLGKYDHWSNWSENSTVSFENLSYGNYTFKVRSRIGDVFSKNTSIYEFEIAKPWYISHIMLVLYALSIIIFSLVMHNAYKNYYKEQHQKLIFKNEQELKLAYAQNEAEIVKIKNQKLKSDISNKSKELAASLMSIAKKNDLLRQVKNELRDSNDDNSVKSAVNTINKSLRQNNDWEFFQEAFNNADSEFLKNLKVLHPKLTPSDLKLCGYLRLNLSTKEMARLLNITTRSVEIKRYRLRKKLNLQHEDNLVNYILEL